MSSVIADMMIVSASVGSVSDEVIVRHSLSMMGLCSVSDVIRGFSKVDYVGQIIHYFSSYEFQLLVMDCSPCRRMLFLVGC